MSWIKDLKILFEQHVELEPTLEELFELYMPDYKRKKQFEEEIEELLNES